MDSSALKTENSKPTGKKPLKETLWNILGVLFYLFVAAGAVYHLIIAR